MSHGKYIINPRLRLRCGEKWVAIYDLLGLPELGFDIRKIEYLTDAEFMEYCAMDALEVAEDHQHAIDVQMIEVTEEIRTDDNHSGSDTPVSGDMNTGEPCRSGEKKSPGND